MSVISLPPPVEAKPADDANNIVALPHGFPSEASIPRWDFLYGTHLLRRTVSGTAAMGATGKSSTSIVEALAMTSGKPLLGIPVPHRMRVLLICLEDNRNTMDKRIAAAMRHHGLTPEDIGGRLYVKAKGEIKFKIAKQARAGSVQRNEKLIEGTVAFLLADKIDVMSIDPIIKTHAVNENDNSAMSDVIECYDDIAERADCAISLWHHTRKGNSLGVTIDSARGAIAFVDACRSVRILETMTKEEAQKHKIEDYRRYFRGFSGKLNFAPSTDQSDWFRITSVSILNGPSLIADFDGSNGGDDVGVVEAWKHPGTREVQLTPENIIAIKLAVAQGEWRDSVQAGMWVGKAIGPILRLDPEDDKPAIKKTIKKLITDGVLKTITGRSEARKSCLFVVCADWTAPLIDLAHPDQEPK